jgi:TetR/AcrR family transcriptional regulator, transcriptional repressor for nem operon
VVTVVQVPLTERGRRSRERIVEAAAAAVAERGAGGCSLDQVLEAAGASKSQLYHYFADKDDLVRAVIARRVGETVGCQGPMLGEIECLVDIRRWFDWLIAQNEEMGCPGCPLGTLANELADRNEAARVDLAGGFDTWISYVIDGLARMQASGELDERAEPERLGAAVFASLQGGLMLSKTYKDPKYLRDALDASYAHLESFRPDRPAS